MHSIRHEYSDREEYLNDDGKLHREDGPARIYHAGYFKGRKEFFINGKLHNENGPSITQENTSLCHYHINGKFHREDGPAKTGSNGDQFWYLHGQYHRVKGPADNFLSKEWSNPDYGWIYLRWQKFNLCHRLNAPAVIKYNKEIAYYSFGRLISTVRP